MNQNNFMPDNFSVLPTEWTYKDIFLAIFTLLLKNSANLGAYAGLDHFLMLRVFLHEKKMRKKASFVAWNSFTQIHDALIPSFMAKVLIFVLPLNWNKLSISSFFVRKKIDIHRSCHLVSLCFFHLFIDCNQTTNSHVFEISSIL